MAASVDGLNIYLASLSPSMKQIQEAAISTQQELEQLRLDFNTFQKLFSADIDAKLLKEREHNRAEILSLRDALRMMIGDKAKFSDYERVSASQLSESTKRRLGIQNQRQLLHCSSTLRQIAGNCIRTIYRGPKPILQFHCRPSQNLVTVRRGVFKFEYERCAQHDPHCPFNQSNVQSWLYTLTIRLLPFLNKTVALTLGATFGAGSWAIASPLRFYTTTERTKSPLFSEFNKFAGVCGRLGILEVDEVGRCERLRRYREFEWDIPKVAQFLDNLIEKLNSSFRAGNASGSDMDESGCTMLHEILLLITILGSRCDSFTVQLHELLRLASLSGVDKFARSEKFPLEWEDTRGYILWINYTKTSSLTAMEILVGQILFAFPSSSRQVEIPVYDTIKPFDLEDTVIWDKVFDHGACYPRMNFASRWENPLKFIMRYPEFIERLEYGELAAPILRRSIDGLRHAIVSPDCKKFLERKYGTFHPLKLAVGWPIGVKILLEEECFTMEAIELAIRTNNIESLEILLSDWSKHPVDWWPEDMLSDWSGTCTPSSYRMVLELASSYGSGETHHCVLRHLNRALWSFNGLDFKCAKKGEKIGSTASDEDSSCCGTPISSEPNNNIWTYHFLDEWEGAGKLLDALYESGITAIDLKSGHQETPLLYRLSRFRDFELVPEAIIWFLQKGANPNFDAPHSWPNIFFYLPLVMSSNKISPGRLENTAPFYSSICDPFQTDGCQFYCSSSGCLPFRQTLTCRVTKNFRRWHQHNCLGRTRVKFKSLEDLARINGVEDCQMATLYTETCRLGVFDRLGMAHTCCSIEYCNETSKFGYWPGRLWRQRFPEAEKERLQDENGELREQLDLIMEAYRRMRETYSGSLEGFWEWWWQTLDDILPDLLPVERCKCVAESFKCRLEPLEEEDLWKEICDKRARREKGALRNSGYLGLEFTDVIRLHFKEYLS